MNISSNSGRQLESLFEKEIQAYKRQIEELENENKVNKEKNAILMDKISSLTELFAKTQSTNENLTKAFEHIHKENSLLRSQSNSLELAPVYMPEKSELALEKVQDQCIQLAGESLSWMSQKDKLTQKVKFLERECARYQRDNNTLGKQVRHLLRTLEEERGMLIRRVQDVNEYSQTQIRTASDVIDQHLITFESVDELQQQNQKLLSLVKELSQRQEERELQVETEETKNLLNEIESLKSELEKVKNDREKIMNAFNLIHKERDLFKILLGKTGQVEHLTPEVFQRMVTIACSSGPVMGLQAPEDSKDKDAHIADLKAVITKLEQQVSEIRDELEGVRRRSQDELNLKAELLKEAHLNILRERQKTESLQDRYSTVETNAKAVMDQLDETRTKLHKITFLREQLEKEKEAAEEALVLEKQSKSSEELMFRSEKQNLLNTIEREREMSKVYLTQVLESIRLRNIERCARVKLQNKLYRFAYRPKVKKIKKRRTKIQEKVLEETPHVSQASRPPELVKTPQIQIPHSQAQQAPQLQVSQSQAPQSQAPQSQVPQLQVPRLQASQPPQVPQESEVPKVQEVPELVPTPVPKYVGISSGGGSTGGIVLKRRKL